MIDFKTLDLKFVKLAVVCVIFASFFLPWIAVESAAVGGVTKLLTGKKQATIDTISGFDVPIKANSSESRFMLSIIKIFNPSLKNADKKSFLIWIVPLFAVLMFFLSVKYNDIKFVKPILGIIGVSIFVVAAFKIFTTDLDKLVLNVRIAYGLWLVLIGYLFFGILEIVDFVKMMKK